MAGDHLQRMQRGHLVERIYPLLTAFDALSVRRPDVHTPRHAGTAKNGFIRRDPHIGGIILRLADLNLFAVDGEGVCRQRLRDVNLLRRAVLHLRAPVGQFGRFGGVNVFNHFRGRHHVDIRESLHQRLEAEIEVRIAGGNHDAGQFFTAFLNHFNQLLPIFDAELSVKQHRFMRAGGEGGVNRENAVLLRVVGLQRQGRDQN